MVKLSQQVEEVKLVNLVALEEVMQAGQKHLEEEKLDCSKLLEMGVL